MVYSNQILTGRQLSSTLEFQTGIQAMGDIYIYVYVCVCVCVCFCFFTGEGHLPESVKLYEFIDSFTMRVRVCLEKITQEEREGS